MRNKLYTKRLEICITAEQKTKLEKWAKDEQITVNQLIREIISDTLS